MEKLTKHETIQELKKIKAYHHERHETTKERNMHALINLIRACNINEYETTRTQHGHVNIGFICERIALNYFNLTKEDDMHEIKSIVNNSAHVLDNEHVKVVYILIINQKIKGLYKVNACFIYGIKLSVKYLTSLKSDFIKVCNLHDLVR